MRQRNLVFTWRPESFNEVLEQPNLVDLRIAFSGKRSLSGSLLIWEKTSQGEIWWLTDFENQKVYHLEKKNDEEIEIWEEAQNSRGWPTPYLRQEVYGTSQGFIDWLRTFKTELEGYDPDRLKRTDLSQKNLSFEIVHPNLLIVYEMFQEILTSPREWFVGLSDYRFQQNIQTPLDQFLKILEIIHSFSSNSPSAEHKDVLHRIFNLCNEIQPGLQETVAWLSLKKTAQLNPQMDERLETQVKDITDKTLESFKEENNLSHESTKQDMEKIQEGIQQLNTKVDNEIAKETVSKHKAIFDKQAKEHQHAAWKWLGGAGSLMIGLMVGIIFFGLLDVLKFEGTAWNVVLQNIFKKGSVLTLFYFGLNHSIKNYKAQKHLEVINRHRQNALDTFDDFIESAGENRETRDAVLIAATNAIFDANQTGYLSAKTKGAENANPIQQVVRTVLPGSSTTKSEN